jgi:hypothetical protein
MSTAAAATTENKETRLSPPTPFNGDRKKLNTFLLEGAIYLTMNKKVYDDDNKKVLFMLSYMKEGMAGHWKESFVHKYTNAAQELVTPSYNDFLLELKRTFEAADKEGDALTKLQTECMTGSETADQFTERFKQWVYESGLKEDRPLITYFQEAIPRSLRNNILLLENVPKTIQGWYDMARKLDNQYRYYKAVSERTQDNQRNNRGNYRGRFRASYGSGRPSTSTADPNAMDIDRMTFEEREKHFKEKLCFVCHKPGHMAGAHRSGSAGNTGNYRGNYQGNYRGTNNRTAAQTHKNVRTMYQELPKEEQEKFLEEFEKTGF